MFSAKQKTLFSVKEKQSTSVFVQQALKSSARTKSGNNAEKFSTTGNPFVDQFGVMGSYKEPRPFETIAKDCEILWASNPLTCVRFIFFLRMITRKTQFDGTSTKESQKGGELRHEGIMRMIWLSQKESKVFKQYLLLFVAVGSWKDLIQMLSYDLIYNTWDKKVLDWETITNIILWGLGRTEHSELIKKYLPQIKANSQCTTIESQADNIIAKYLCKLLFGEKEGEEGKTYKQYRKMKVSGTAHSWQQLISRGKFNEIDFNKIHGRALNILAKSKFFKNNGLEDKYNEWIGKDDTKAKYTGYVHELFEPCTNYSSLVSLGEGLINTINKQFITLVEKAKDNKQRPATFIVVRDTSGSMGSSATGSKMRCYDIAKALALYFSEFLTGKFADNWIEFNKDAKMHEWKGKTALDRWYNDRTQCVGNTNFQSVIDLFCKIKKEGMAEEEFPTGILCISDSEFNPSRQLKKTNVEVALDELRYAGFSEEYVSKFVIVLWNLQSRAYGEDTGKKFETYGGVPNVFYFSGFSASIVAFLDSGEIKTAEDLFNAAMNQELLQFINF